MNDNAFVNITYSVIIINILFSYLNLTYDVVLNLSFEYLIKLNPMFENNHDL